MTDLMSDVEKDEFKLGAEKFQATFAVVFVLPRGSDENEAVSSSSIP